MSLPQTTLQKKQQTKWISTGFCSSFRKEKQSKCVKTVRSLLYLGLPRFFEEEEEEEIALPTFPAADKAIIFLPFAFEVFFVAGAGNDSIDDKAPIMTPLDATSGGESVLVTATFGEASKGLTSR
jgi:hypothetical protein